MNPLFDLPCVVMANGAFPEREELWAFVRSARTLIACDGAAERLLQAGIVPTAIVGDLDSLSPALRQRYAERIHPVIDQEINDLTKSLHHAASMGEREVLILGATGLREDHTLGNLSLLLEHAARFDRLVMASDYGWFVPLTHSTTLSSQPGQQVSLFSLQPGGTISSEGLRWPLCERQLTAWWQGTLNEAVGDSFTLTLSPEARLLVYRTFERKLVADR